MGEQAAAKMCFVCGRDVTNSPRVKDDQGRYMCKGACEQKARQRAASGAAAARAADAGGMGVMSQLIDQSPMTGATPCGNCGNPMPKGQVVCLRCGFDVRTGRTQRTRVTAEKVPKEAGPIKMPRRRGEFGPSGGVLLLIGLGVIGGFCLMGFVNPAFLAIGMLLSLGALVVGMIWGIYSAFVSGESTWGVIGVLSFIVPFVGIAFLYYLLVPNEDKWSKSIYASGLLGWLLGLVIMFAAFGGPDALTGSLGP